ncbi:hypothetical protein F5Y14DRAFT_404827 [Nemania sp. NC0429]|nr:hypothetical protein F5Y14DRAFT_404827 [Nemania sp. NC0429]
MASGASSDMFLSFRTSCDRCRFQKLKCSVLASSEAPKGTVCCERCARAMVPCVFSRRNRSRRTISGSKADREQLRARSAADPSSGDSRATILDGHNRSMPTNMFSLDSSWDQVSARNTVAPHEFTRLESTLTYTPQPDSALDHMGLFANGFGFGAQGNSGQFSWENSDIASASPAASEDNNNSSHSSTFEANAEISERDSAIGMLLHLASDLHTKLETLKNRPQQQRDVPKDLDGYPIGSVLHLLQNFTTIASSTSSGVDASMVLILLSCYITMTQICTLVLGHFESYLSSQPDSPSSARVKPGPQVCLGELPSTNPPHSQIYTAVSLLLESARQVEAALGLTSHCWVGDGLEPQTKGSATRDETLSNASTKQGSVGTSDYWELLTGVSSIQEPFSMFAKKVEDIKDVLREKMGL